MTQKKPTTKTLSVDELVLDGGTQSRVSIDEETVACYAEILASCNGRWPFPKLVVFNDGSRHLVSSGFHRTLAAIRVKRSTIPCEVKQGTAWDALVYGMTANDTHGLRMTQADKRRCVEVLLDSEKRLTREEVASAAGVTKRTVQRIVAERKEGGGDIVTPPSGRQGTFGSSGDPFNVDDPFEDEGLGEDDRTESDDQEGPQEPPPGRSGESRDHSGGNSPSPAELFKTQRSKTVKTMEAAMRAFDDLNDLRKRKTDHSAAITACKKLLDVARNW